MEMGFERIKLNRESQTIFSVSKNRLKPRFSLDAVVSSFWKPDKRSDFRRLIEPVKTAV